MPLQWQCVVLSARELRAIFSQISLKSVRQFFYKFQNPKALVMSIIRWIFGISSSPNAIFSITFARKKVYLLRQPKPYSARIIRNILHIVVTYKNFPTFERIQILRSHEAKVVFPLPLSPTIAVVFLSLFRKKNPQKHHPTTITKTYIFKLNITDIF